MASNNKTIRFTIKTVTEGGEEVQALGVNVKDLAEAITSTQKKASKGVQLKADAIGFNAITDMIGKLNSVLQDLSGAYAVQQEAETKLAVAMRNTMNASEGEIQSIKDLCSAQQSLGVIGDEVQLQGAERLSTYLETTDALKELIPVMNDLTVKQFGMNASGENAAQAAAMLGKAMQGNTTALKRLGIEFTDAQKVILEYGTEAEKAALISEVVGFKVGGMNAELAKTDAGKMKQFSNTLGDLKERMGSMTAKISPLLQGLTQIGTAGLGVKTTIQSINTIIPIFSKVTQAATASIKGMSLALRGAMIATGVGVAIAALTFVIEKLIATSDKASDSLDGLTDAERRAADRAEEMNRINQQAEQSAKQSETAYRLNITRLKEFNGTKEEEKKLVKEMNGLYGESMGYFSSVAGWYKALTENSEAYCRQLVVQAKTQAMVQKVATMETEKSEIEEKLKKGKNQGGYDYVRYIKKGKRQKSEKDLALEDLERLNEGITAGYEEINSLVKEAGNIQFKNTGSKTPIVENGKESKGSADKEKKAEEARLKAKEDADKKYLELMKSNAGDVIELMDEGYEKEYAKIESAYVDKILTIGQKEKELTDLRIKEGKEGLDESEQELFDYARELAEKFRDKAIEALKPIPVSEIKTYDELSKALSYWNTQFNKASESEREEIYKTISALNSLKDSFDMDVNLADSFKELTELKALDGQQFKIEVKATGMDGWLEKMRQMQKVLSDPRATETQKKNAAELAEEYRKLAAESVNSFDMINQGWGSLKGLGSNIRSLTEAIDGQKDAWETLTGVIDSMIGIYQQVMQMMQMVDTLTKVFTATKQAETVVTKAATSAKVEGASEEVAASGSVVAANAAETTSEVAKASAETFSAHASIPWVGIAAAGAMVAAMLATMLSLPKFADGGIVSGPTLGIMGEYAGASGNPEVIAPLDKLKSMLGETGGGAVVVMGEMKVKGKELVAVLSNTTRINSKSGKRSGIK